MEELGWIEIYVVVRATEIKVISHKQVVGSRGHTSTLLVTTGYGSLQ